MLLIVYGQLNGPVQKGDISGHHFSKLIIPLKFIGKPHT